MHDLERARPYCDWHEDIGDVLWWEIPVKQAPYVGSPLDLGLSIPVTIEVAGRRLDTQRLDGFFAFPWAENERSNLWWTPLPAGKMIEDQVPL